MDYIQQFQDSEAMKQSFNFLQEIDVGEESEDEEINALLEMDQLLDMEQEGADEVVLSPCQNAPQPEVAPQIAQKKAWGPTQAQRKSSRVDIGGRTMLEIAVGKKKVQNLEADKNSLKGTIVKNSFDKFFDPAFVAFANKICVEIYDNCIKKDSCIPRKPVGFEENFSSISSTEHSALEIRDNIFSSSLDKPEGLTNPVDTIDSPCTPKSLKGFTSLYEEHSAMWTKVSKYGRGKHPMKNLFR